MEKFLLSRSSSCFLAFFRLKDMLSYSHMEIHKACLETKMSPFKFMRMSNLSNDDFYIRKNYNRQHHARIIYAPAAWHTSGVHARTAGSFCLLI